MGFQGRFCAPAALLPEIAAGLDLDFRGEPFGPTPILPPEPRE